MKFKEFLFGMGGIALVLVLIILLGLAGLAWQRYFNPNKEAKGCRCTFCVIRRLPISINGILEVKMLRMVKPVWNSITAIIRKHYYNISYEEIINENNQAGQE